MSFPPIAHRMRPLSSRERPRPRNPRHHRRCRRRRAFGRGDCGLYLAAGSRRADSIAGFAGIGFAALDRANAGRHSSRNAGDRDSGCEKRRIARRQHHRHSRREGSGKSPSLSEETDRCGAGTAPSMTQILPSRTAEERAKAVNSAVAFLRSGDPVALPTETVYGLAADALDAMPWRRFSRRRSDRASIR